MFLRLTMITRNTAIVPTIITKAKTPPTAPAIARLVVAGDGTVSVVTVPLRDRSEVTVALLVTLTLTTVNMSELEVAELVISSVGRVCVGARVVVVRRKVVVIARGLLSLVCVVEVVTESVAGELVTAASQLTPALTVP